MPVYHTLFAPEEVYTPIELIARAQDDGNNDFAVIRLDRSIPAERHATIRATKVLDGEPVFVVGHPCGLPLKYADGATVLDNAPQNFFLADLDTYGGNSGSPVYDTAHHVVGILVRGARDFRLNHSQDCYYSNVCRSAGTPGCTGETVSRTQQFLPYISTSNVASLASATRTK